MSESLTQTMMPEGDLPGQMLMNSRSDDPRLLEEIIKRSLLSGAIPNMGTGIPDVATPGIPNIFSLLGR